ncbi:MAG: hypothetical protein FJ261_11685 [Planctomycetes bacterium]|nr:hypothetical protein [Planctomycetota bacterium]
MAGTRDPHQVVQQIQGFLRSNNQELTQEIRELSREYADWGRHAADRLRRCEEFLQKGLRSEAVHHARLDPPLLDLAGTLLFPQHGQWDEVVTMYGLPSTPVAAVPPETLAELNHAFAEEEILANDMRQYRRLVLDRSPLAVLAEKLRAMLLLEPNHPGLKDNLRDVEAQKVADILESIRKADRAGKPDEVGLYHKELVATPWISPPSAAIVDEIQRIFNKNRSRILEEAIKTLGAQIVEAHGKHDSAALTRLLADWDRMASEAGVTAGEKRARAVETARMWVTRVQAEQEVRMQHEMALSELASALGVENDIKRLFTLYERVLSFKGKLPKGTVLIPPQLEHRFEDVANKLENKNDFNRMLVLVGTISFGVVALVVFLIFVMTR